MKVIGKRTLLWVFNTYWSRDSSDIGLLHLDYTFHNTTPYKEEMDQKLSKTILAYA